MKAKVYMLEKFESLREIARKEKNWNGFSQHLRNVTILRYNQIESISNYKICLARLKNKNQNEKEKISEISQKFRQNRLDEREPKCWHEFPTANKNIVLN